MYGNIPTHPGSSTKLGMKSVKYGIKILYLYFHL